MIRILLIVAVVITSCSKSDDEKIFEIYPGLISVEGLYYKIDSDIPFTGSTISEYNSGNPYILAEFREGKLEGTYKAYYQNGRKMGESNYRNGLKEGKSIAWHENGNKASETYFVNNMKSGKLEIYYFTGEKKTEAFFIDDKLDSTLTQWDMEGNITSVETYEKGVFVE